MRSRKGIEEEGAKPYAPLGTLTLEVLLDIRALLKRQTPKRKYKKKRTAK